jgi:hypothetical protein
MMLMDLLESSRQKEKVKVLLPVLNELLSNGLGLSNSGSELIQNNLGEELTPEVANAIVQLTSSDLSPKMEFYQQRPTTSPTQGAQGMEEKSVEELEQMLHAAVQNGKPIKSIQKALLFTYCRKKDLEKAEALKQV